MTARLALALLFIVPAALAYPFETVTQRWVFGAAIAVVVILFAWWSGDFATDKVARRWAIWRGNRSTARPVEIGNTATVLLSIDEPVARDLPVALIAGYVERYGLRCDKVRVTSRDAAGERHTWITVTLSATDNLPALQARSAQIPLQETTHVLARRLADQLHEEGWSVTVGDEVHRPVPVSPGASETWRAVGDDAGFLTAYRIAVDALPDTLRAVWALPTDETWTAVEFGPATVAAVAAVRSTEPPASTPPVTGLLALGGRQRQVLDALDPASSQRLPGHQPAERSADEIRWPASTTVRT